MANFEEVLGKLRQWIKPWETGTEPMEIRRAVLDDVESRIVAAGGGKRIFPFNRVRVQLLAGSPEEKAELEGIVREAWDLTTAIPERLRERDAKVPADLTVHVQVLEQAETEPGDRRWRVACERVEPEAPAETGRPELVLTVLKGAATQKVYNLTSDRIYLGRLEEVLDHDGRVKRRNDVAFLDTGEVNQTVSREHARITWNRDTRDFWLRAEQKSGTRVVREGRTLDVNPQDRQGVRLRPGDEIYLGRACVKVGVQ